MNAKKNIFITALFLILLISANAQNGFVITGKLPTFPSYSFSNNIFITINGETLTAYDTTGRKIAEGHSIKYFAKDMLIVDSLVNKNISLFGVINTKGETVIPKKYYELNSLNDGLALAKNKYDRYGYINIKGETILPFSYNMASQLSDGVATVECDFRNFGIIDAKGHFVLPCRDPGGPLMGLFRAEPFINGFSVVNVEDLYLNKYSIISKKGKLLIPATNKIPVAISKSFFTCNDKIYLYNEDLDSAIIVPLSNPKNLGYGVIWAKENNDSVVYNSKGKFWFKIPSAYHLEGFNGNTFVAFNTTKKVYCILDTTGKEIFPNTLNKFQVDKIISAYDGYNGIKKDDLFGILNEKNKMIIPPQFEQIDWGWYRTNNRDYLSTYSSAKYQGEFIIFRPKTTAELKKEEQLIAQKKLPTADECFAKAKAWIENQKAEKALVDAEKKEKPNNAKENDDFEKRNSKEQVLGRQTANYVKYVNWYNEAFDKLIKELTACMKVPITKTCTNEHWRHTNDANYGWIGITQNLKRMKTELNEIKKINYSYLCSNNSNSIAKKIESNIKEIDVLLDGYEIGVTSDLKYLVGKSIEGADFALYANELKSFQEFKFKKITPHLMTIAASSEALIKLLAGCK